MSNRANRGEWVWHFSIGHDIRYNQRGWRVFVLIVGKMRNDLPEGVELRQRDLWGLCLRFGYWLPVDRY